MQVGEKSLSCCLVQDSFNEKLLALKCLIGRCSLPQNKEHLCTFMAEQKGKQQNKSYIINTRKNQLSHVFISLAPSK